MDYNPEKVWNPDQMRRTFVAEGNGGATD